MADKNPGFKIGEYARGSMLETVELSAAIAAADVGKPLKGTGVNSDGQLKVEVHSDNEAAIAVSIIESVGAAGDLVEVLMHGDVKIRETDGAIAAGAAITAKDGKFLTLPDAADGGNIFRGAVGFSRAVFAAAGTDQGLICFSGP